MITKLSKHNKTTGFTLVELAIVITIIGILIGGVLKGQQLIEQARLAGTIQQLNAYKTALMIFQSKYDAMPGDMPDPEKKIIDCTGCVATAFPFSETLNDGNIGGIDEGRNIEKTNVLGSENTRFWLHLYKADMISGVSDVALSGGPVAWGQTHPAAKIGGGFSVGDLNSENNGVWGGNKGPRGTGLLLHENASQTEHGNYMDSADGVLIAVQAASIDQKMDDGQPDSGDVRSIGCTNGKAAPDAEYTAKVHTCPLVYIIEK